MNRRDLKALTQAFFAASTRMNRLQLLVLTHITPIIATYLAKNLHGFDKEKFLSSLPYMQEKEPKDVHT